MEQTPEKSRFNKDLDRLSKALATLREALSRSAEDLIVRDACIQRFEYLFELSWKTMKRAALLMGTECQSPRESLLFAFRSKWIDSLEEWLDAMKARNLTSHTYEDEIARSVYNVAVKFPVLVEALLHSLQKITLTP